MHFQILKIYLGTFFTVALIEIILKCVEVASLKAHEKCLSNVLRSSSTPHVALVSTAADCGGSGSSNGEEKAGKAEGDAGPSCSSLSSKAAGDNKSRFFDDSEESEGEEEEGSDEEVRTGDKNKSSYLAATTHSL